MALRKELLSLFVAAVAINTAGNIVGPFLPLYLQSLEASVVVVGLLMSLINLAQAVVRIPGGLIADRFEEKRILVLTLLLAMVPPIALLSVNHWSQTIPWLFIYGMPFSLFTPIWNVTIANHTDNSHRARVFGLMNMAWPIGVIIGPLVGGILSESVGWFGIMYSLLAVYSIGLIFVVMATRHTPRSETVRSKMGHVEARPFTMYVLFQCLVALGYGSINPILPLYITNILGATKGFVGLFWTICYGVTFLLTQVPGGRLAERFPLQKSLLLGVLTAPLLLVAMPFNQNLILFLLLNVALNTLWNLSVPAGNVLFLDLLPENGRGFYTGVNEAMIMLAWTVAPSLSAFLYDSLGSTVPFLASAIFFALAAASTRGFKSST